MKKLTLRSVERVRTSLIITLALTVRGSLSALAGRYAGYWWEKDRIDRARLGWASFGIDNEQRLQRARGVSTVLWDLARGAFASAWLVIPLLGLAIGLDAAGPFVHGLVHFPLHLPAIVPAFLNTAVAAVSQILVIILGLYFAPFSIIASSTLYAQVPEEVRELLLRNRSVGTFMGMLAVAASFAISVLALQALGYKPQYGTFIIAILLGIYGVVAFAKFAPTLFRLFEPKYLLDSLSGDLLEQIEAVSVAGKRYQEPPIQDYHRRVAQRYLNALQHISQLKHVVVTTYVETAKFCFSLMGWYAAYKNDIPRDSLWWLRRPSHTDWLTAAYTKLRVRVTTLTRMEPEPKIDRLWVERVLARVLADSLRGVGEGDAEVAFADLMRKLTKCMWDASYFCCIQEGLLIARSMFDVFIDLAQRPRDPLDERQQIVRLGALDAIGVACANIVLGLHQRLENLNLDVIGAAFEDIRKDRKEPEHLSLPEEARAGVERAGQIWGTERRVYGRPVTPSAFFVRECQEALEPALTERVRRAVTTPHELLLPLSEKLADSQSRAILLQGVMDTAVRGKRLVDKFLERFPNSNREAANDLKSGLDGDFDEALRQLSAISLESQAVHNEDYPDLLGQAYHFVTQGIFESILEADAEAIERWASVIFRLGLAGIIRVETELVGKRFDFWTNQIVEDLIDLSGYAIVASGVAGCDLWSPMRLAWDAFIAEHSEEILRRFGNVIKANRPALRVSPRSLLRHEWWLRFREYLQGKHILPPDLYSLGFYGDDEIPRHRNPVVATYVDGRDIEEDELLSIFAILYVKRRHPAVLPAFGDDVEYFERQLKRMRARLRGRHGGGDTRPGIMNAIRLLHSEPHE